LSVSKGAGHSRAAEPLRAEAQASFPGVEAQHLDVTTFVSASFRNLPWHKHWRGMEPNLYP